MGDFTDDYAVAPDVRDGLGLLFLVTLSGPETHAPVRIEALPLCGDYCRIRMARGAQWEWMSPASAPGSGPRWRYGVNG